ncbi:DsbC family protein [Thalassomonas sp. RHCl1]|uniref:DsbC family protein n=1 Tax=Thalassomonas sp. RHCl1 TaxID=2995320 RepID=UPI00248C8A75|nr:DsbC family protein [Thalassomonas sp. RHCl1]
MYQAVQAVFVLIFLSGPAMSQQLNPVLQEPELSLIKAKLNKIDENWQIASIEKSPLTGFYRANMNGGKVIYYSDSTGYFFEGDLYKSSATGAVNITDITARARRKMLISTIDLSTAIVYSPQGQVKAVVYAFMDVDCGACRNLHKQTEAMNELGIEIRYLAYPRAGLNSDTYHKMTTAWCAENRKQRIEDLMINIRSPYQSCKNSPVGEHFKLGQLMGLIGTPGIVLMDGTLLHGYRTANQLAQALAIF